jgi:MbtH protein
MTNLLDDETAAFLVVINDAGQYSIWPDAIVVPAGWTTVRRADTRRNCLTYINENWRIV